MTALLHHRHTAEAAFPENNPFSRQPGMILQFIPTSSFQSAQIICTSITEPSSAALGQEHSLLPEGWGSQGLFFRQQQVFLVNVLCFLKIFVIFPETLQQVAGSPW